MNSGNALRHGAGPGVDKGTLAKRPVKFENPGIDKGKLAKRPIKFENSWDDKGKLAKRPVKFENPGVGDDGAGPGGPIPWEEVISLV